MTKIRLPYVQAFGRYHYFRRPGYKRVRLPGPPGSAEFMEAYRLAEAQAPRPIGLERSKPGSVSAAIAAYYVSNAWAGLSDGTRAMRRAILERFRNQYGEFPLAKLHENFLLAYLDTLKPHAARNHLKALRGLLQHARHDVTRGIKAPKAKSNKHPSWPADMIAQYEARHAIGSKARLCFTLAKCTGAGRAEIARLGPQHIRGDEVELPARQKTGVTGFVTLLPELREVIGAMPVTGLTTFLVTKTGKPYAPNDLSDQFRQWCDEAGIPAQYSLHGLRHRMGDQIAEHGGTPNEIAGALGHRSPRTAMHYTQGADRRLMGTKATRRLIKADEQ